MKTFFVFAGNYREYSLHCLTLAEQIQAQEGGSFKVRSGFGRAPVFFTETWQLKYLASERDLRGAENYTILNVGTWSSRKDLEVIQAIYRSAAGRGVAL